SPTVFLTEVDGSPVVPRRVQGTAPLAFAAALLRPEDLFRSEIPASMPANVDKQVSRMRRAARLCKPARAPRGGFGMRQPHGLRYALLGVVSRSSAGIHGYALRKKCERVLGGFWQLNFGEIYRILDRLVDENLIE